MVPRQDVPHARRQGEFPLPHWHVWKHVLDQMRGALRHPPPTAAGTEAAPFARKGHEPLVPARSTQETGEARREASTRQKVLECPLHKPREAMPITSPRRLRAERLVVIADDGNAHGTVDGKDRARRGGGSTGLTLTPTRINGRRNCVRAHATLMRDLPHPPTSP